MDGVAGTVHAAQPYIKLCLGNVDILPADGAGAVPAITALPSAVIEHVHLHLTGRHRRPCDSHDVLLCDRADVFHPVARTKRSRSTS